MKLIVGLGNPGQKYLQTRHNIGFVMLDAWADRCGLHWKFESKYKAEIAVGEIFGEKVLLVKPQTYMNLSGETVAPLARFYKIEAGNILVLHDEIDFVLAKISLKFGGGSAGHNGLKSIIDKMGTRDFWRLRIGVDRPKLHSQVSDWVLGVFNSQEKNVLREQEGEIFDLIDSFVKE